jgi:tRNA-uridine aminocarboxypropyltransferase
MLARMASSSATPEPRPVAENRVFVLVLQHPQEQREARATAAVAVAALARARLVAGLSWPNLGQALGRRADPRRWAVLYLGSARPAAVDDKREIAVIGRAGKPLDHPEAVLRNLDGIVLLDGTWSQAKTLWWRNPWLLKLHRLVLNPPRPARLGEVRREPRAEALSTIEAAALALRHLEAGSAAADALSAELERMLERARRPPQPTESA